MCGLCGVWCVVCGVVCEKREVVKQANRQAPQHAQQRSQTTKNCALAVYALILDHTHTVACVLAILFPKSRPPHPPPSLPPSLPPSSLPHPVRKQILRLCLASLYRSYHHLPTHTHAPTLSTKQMRHRLRSFVQTVVLADGSSLRTPTFLDKNQPRVLLVKVRVCVCGGS